MAYKKRVDFNFISTTSENRFEIALERFVSDVSPEALLKIATGTPYVVGYLHENDSLLILRCLLKPTKQTSNFDLSFFSQKIDWVSWAVSHKKVHHPTLPSNQLLLIELQASFDKKDVEKATLLAHDMAIALQFPEHISRLSNFSGQIKDELFNQLLRHPDNFAGVLEESSRLFSSATEEFSQIRSGQTLLKIARSLLWLKTRLLTKSKESIGFRIFPSHIHCPFGTRSVLSLAIVLPKLQAYEQFDQQHIAQAVKRSFPNLQLVPRSFFSYRHPETQALSFYLEFETKESSLPSLRSLYLARKDLERELIGSIEKVVSRIDIPQNDDDLLRNLLLLNQEITRINDKPNVIIQYHEQTEETLSFYVTLVRVIKQSQKNTPVTLLTADGIRSILLNASLLDTLKESHVKQGLEFLVQCPKTHYYRRDRSIDFLKARESVLRYLEKTFGKLRDLNGGFMYEHDRLLQSVKGLLRPEEKKDLFIIENLINSLMPSIMKSLLGPEHILTAFRQFQKLRTKPSRVPIVEEYAREFFIGFISAKNFTKEEILQTPFNLPENQVAICHTFEEGQQYCFVLCLQDDPSMRQKLLTWVQERLNTMHDRTHEKVLRLSIPTAPSFDPRLVYDHRAGAVLRLLYEGLMRFDTQGMPTPALAQQINVLNDNKTYLFHLKDTCWSDGSRLTAGDFVYAWKTYCNPAFKHPFPHLFFPIKNAKAIKNNQLPADCLGVHALAPTLLAVELEYPFPHFLDLCCHWIYSPLSQTFDSTHPALAYFGSAYHVFNGPYVRGHQNGQNTVTLQKNPNYWEREKIPYDRIELTQTDAPIDHFPSFPEHELFWFSLNTQKVPFRSPKIRRAFSYALPRHSILPHPQSVSRPASSFLPTQLSLLSDKNPIPYDPDYAAYLFREGMEDQKLFCPPLTMVIPNHPPLKTLAGQAIDVWQKTFDTPISLNVLDWNHFYEKPCVSDIVGAPTQNCCRDPLFAFTSFQDSPSHASFWEHDNFSLLIEQAKRMPQPSRNKFLKQAEQLLLLEMPIIPVCEIGSYGPPHVMHF